MSGSDSSDARGGLGGGEQALVHARTFETLSAAYDAWRELTVEHAARCAALAKERRGLDEQGRFLVGAVKSAAQTGGQPLPEPSAVAPQGREQRESGSGPSALSSAPKVETGLSDFLHQAEARLEAARVELEARSAAVQSAFAAAEAELEALILERTARFVGASRPRVSLSVHSPLPGKKLLHAARLSGDEPVLLLFALTGRIPSRHGFLFDDTTDDVQRPPPPLYAERGVAESEVRPSARQLRERCREVAPVLPVKGFVPVFVPSPEGERFYRFLQRGAVMEVELQDGEDFRSILTEAEAELFAGFLLRKKLEGALELELRAG